MLDPSSKELDQTLFHKNREPEFARVIIDAAQSLEQANEKINCYEGFDLDAKRAGMAEEFEGDESYQQIVELLGDDDLVNELVAGVTGMDKPEIKDEEYIEARKSRNEAATTLVDHTCGYYVYMKENLVKYVGEEEEEATDQAWTTTWRKLHDILSSTEGTLLAEVTGFIDGLVKERFEETYKPIERDRGPVVSQDACARTFYKVMESHLSRAIIGANRDEWTGYK